MMTPFHNPQQLKKNSHRKKREGESEEGQKHWKIQVRKSYLIKSVVCRRLKHLLVELPDGETRKTKSETLNKDF